MSPAVYCVFGEHLNALYRRGKCANSASVHLRAMCFSETKCCAQLFILFLRGNYSTEGLCANVCSDCVTYLARKVWNFISQQMFVFRLYRHKGQTALKANQVINDI
jgi:hypothetical protein